MDDYTALSQLLANTPILLADGEAGEVRLITESQAVDEMTHRRPAVLLANVSRSLHRFRALAGVAPGKTYHRADLSKVAGVSEETIAYWATTRVLKPSARRPTAGRGHGPRYTFADLFAGGVIGMARRQGMPLEVLRQVQPMFQQQIMVEK